MLTPLAGQIANTLTGIDPVAAGDLAEKKKANRNPVISDTFSIYEGRKNAMESLKIAIREFVADSKAGVWFLVDELDRCRPDYAISYLETIKHIFDINGAVFILAADRNQLENSARAAFGAKLDFEEYYRKFIHREIMLPAISAEGYKKIATKYVGYYLQREGTRNCFMKIDHDRVDDISDLIGNLKLTPRQIQEVFRILGHVLETSEKNKGRIYWCLAIGSILMATLKIGKPDIYILLGNHELEPKNASDFLNTYFKGRHLDWWFSILYTGGGLKVAEDKSAEAIFQDAGLIKEGEDFKARFEFGQYRMGWGQHHDGIPTIYTKIEQVSQWN